MKVKRKEEEEKFKPVTIELTFETEEEIAAFYALFNHMGNTEMLDKHNFSHEEIRNILIGTIQHPQRFHSELCKTMKDWA